MERSNYQYNGSMMKRLNYQYNIYVKSSNHILHDHALFTYKTNIDNDPDSLYILKSVDQVVKEYILDLYNYNNKSKNNWYQAFKDIKEISINTDDTISFEVCIKYKNDRIDILGVDMLKYHTYGESWYKHNLYKDYTKNNMLFRIHRSLLIVPFTTIEKGKKVSGWKLYIACTEVYRWKRRKTSFPKMNNEEIKELTDSFMRSFLRNNKKSSLDFDPENLRRYIYYEFNKRFGKIWLDYYYDRLNNKKEMV